jgi:hypothetical protein
MHAEFWRVNPGEQDRLEHFDVDNGITLNGSRWNKMVMRGMD